MVLANLIMDFPHMIMSFSLPIDYGRWPELLLKFNIHLLSTKHKQIPLELSACTMGMTMENLFYLQEIIVNGHSSLDIFLKKSISITPNYTSAFPKDQELLS